jgi:hypothetical protein
MLARRSRFPRELDLLSHLDAVHELARSVATRRGFLDPETIEGIEDVCDGSHPSVREFKASFIDAVEIGLSEGVYGEEDT